MFSCNKPMCLYKRQTYVSNYCKFQLSSDIEKNPGPTPVCIDPIKTICRLIYNKRPRGLNADAFFLSVQ